jgi:DNA-binding MarR family transcriptional regulator
MASRKNVQDAHISEQIRVLHGALISIASAMNRPQGDEDLIRAAGIRLDRALFPLLVGIERLGPIGVVDLADRVGRDYTTVSRQVAKLEQLGLVDRRACATDGRVRMASVTPKGKAMTDAIDAAREKKARALFASWDMQDFDNLVSLMRRLADAIDKPPARASRGPASDAA